VKKQIDEYLTGLLGPEMNQMPSYELEKVIMSSIGKHVCRKTGGRCDSPSCPRNKSMKATGVTFPISNRPSIIPKATIAETPGPGYYIGGEQSSLVP
jgi:hypothetical protein